MGRHAVTGLLVAMACAEDGPPADGGDVGGDAGADSPQCLGHTDCFGSAPICREGVVWESLGRTSLYPELIDGVCRYPGTAPVCFYEMPVFTCASGCAPKVSIGLSYCLHPMPGKPARLHPDEARFFCAEFYRDAPDGGTNDGGGVYGTCGLAPSDLEHLATPSALQLIPGRSCGLCLAQLSPDRACVRQVCTQECRLDQDCPSTTTCRCLLNPSATAADSFEVRRFCAPVNQNANEIFAWPRCPEP